MKRLWLILLFVLIFLLGGFSYRVGMLSYIKQTIKGNYHKVNFSSESIVLKNVKMLEAHKPLLSLDNYIKPNIDHDNPRLKKNWKNWHNDLSKKLAGMLKIETNSQKYIPRYKEISKKKIGSLVQHKFLVEVENDVWLPVFIIIKNGISFPAPTLILFHGHGYGSRNLISLPNSYERNAAVQLAKEGFVTITFDLRGFGETGWKGSPQDPIHRSDIQFNHIIGRNQIGVFINDAIRILDFAIDEFSQIDPQKIGAGGCSLGGVLSVWMGIFDNRIKSIYVASSTPGINKSVLINEMKKLTDFKYARDTRAVYNNENAIFGILQVADRKDIVSLVAPKYLFLDLEYGSSRLGSKDISRIRTVFKLLGVERKLTIERHHEGHIFRVKSALAFFKRTL